MSEDMKGQGAGSEDREEQGMAENWAQGQGRAWTCQGKVWDLKIGWSQELMTAWPTDRTGQGIGHDDRAGHMA